MKRQIVLENDQLIEMVNESAKRVLRGLMTEGFIDDVAETLGYIPQGGSGGTTARMVYDENGTAYLLDANNKPIEGFKVYYDAQGNPLYFDANNNPITVDTGQGQQGQEQQGNWITNALAGTAIGDVLGIQNPNQSQNPDEKAFKYLEYMTSADTQIADLEAKIAQMEKNDPNNPMLGGLKANLQMLNNQKQMFQPYLQDYYSNLKTQCTNLEAKMRSGQQLTPDEMNKYTQANQTLMAINGSSAYQYMVPQGPFQNSPVLNKIASFLGFNNNNQQQQQGAQSAQTTQAGAQQSQNAQGGQQRQVQQQRPVAQQRRPQQQRPVAQQRQQRPVVQQRQPAPRPAVVSTGATSQTPQQSATTAASTANTSTATPATANRVATNSGQQSNTNGLRTQVRSTPALGNTVAGYNPNFNPNNVRVRPVQIPQNPNQQQRR